MGNYAECWLDDLFIGSTKNNVDTDLISLFRPQDKIVRGAPIANLPIHLEHYRDSLDMDSDLKVIYYEVPITIVRDRLYILGYDLTTAKEAFRTWTTMERNKSLELAEEMQKKDSSARKIMVDYYKKSYNILSSLSPEVWIEGLRQIHTSGLNSDYYGKHEGLHENPIIEYMLSNDWYGYPGYDLFVPLRLALEAFDDKKKLIYDLTDLVWSGYFEYDEDFVEYGVGAYASEYNLKSKTIVLTEGKTDAWILAESLNFLYPHLKDYYSFLDFENTEFGGGVGNLVNVVKAFAGAGIVNNIIALFDNDTASISACKALENISLPTNITIQHLPDLDLLRNYPTIGPSGTMNLDINGVAASIELYLGEDVLRIDGDQLIPIQWTSFDKLTKKYQGEVLEKFQLQTRFREKISRARNGEELDWRGLQAIFQLIFTSFIDKNRNRICKRPSEYYSH